MDMGEPRNKKQNEFDTKTENELKKIMLSLEHGMDFSKSFASPDMLPETERHFLNYIQNWEDQYAQRKMTTVYEMAGRPTFRLINDVPDGEINATLGELIEHLNKHSIQLDTLCVVSDKELYRFITEELLNVEMADIYIDGMMHCFTYEEFHPNHPYDIKNRCTEFIRHIADKRGDKAIIPWGLADQITSSGQVYTKEALNERLVRFHGLFSDLTLNEFNYVSVTLDESENEAIAIAYVDCSGMTNGQPVKLAGDCNFYLKREYEWWVIYQFETPWKI